MMYSDGIFFLDKQETKYPTFSALLMPNADAVTHVALTHAAMKTAELSVIHTETFGIHYAKTGIQWLKNVRDNKDFIIKKYGERHYKAYE